MRKAVFLHSSENAARLSRYSSTGMAAIFGISQRQLQRRFGDQKLHLWLRQLRIADARQLLAPHKLVKEVAAFLGYKQVSHFSRQFKQFSNGASPETYAQLRGRTWRSEGFEAQYVELLNDWKSLGKNV